MDGRGLIRPLKIGLRDRFDDSYKQNSGLTDGGAKIYRAPDGALIKSAKDPDDECRLPFEQLTFEQSRRFAKQFTLAEISKPFTMARRKLDRKVTHFDSYIPFIKGKSLKEILAKGPLDISTVLHGGYQLLQQMEFLVNEQIAYKDLKPENIIVDEDGNWRLIDFGISRQLDLSLLYVREDEPGIVSGSPPYISLEQAIGEANLKSDLESWALTLINAITGENRFKHSSDNFELMSGEHDHLLSDNCERIIDKVCNEGFFSEYQKTALRTFSALLAKQVNYVSGGERMTVAKVVEVYEKLLDLFYHENGYEKVQRSEEYDYDHVTQALDKFYPRYMHRRVSMEKLNKYLDSVAQCEAMSSTYRWEWDDSYPYRYDSESVLERIDRALKKTGSLPKKPFIAPKIIQSKLDYEKLELSHEEYCKLYEHKLQQSIALTKDLLFDIYDQESDQAEIKSDLEKIKDMAPDPQKDLFKYVHMLRTYTKFKVYQAEVRFMLKDLKKLYGDDMLHVFRQCWEEAVATGKKLDQESLEETTGELKQLRRDLVKLMTKLRTHRKLEEEEADLDKLSIFMLQGQWTKMKENLDLGRINFLRPEESGLKPSSEAQGIDDKVSAFKSRLMLRRRALLTALNSLCKSMEKDSSKIGDQRLAIRRSSFDAEGFLPTIEDIAVSYKQLYELWKSERDLLTREEFKEYGLKFTNLGASVFWMSCDFSAPNASDEIKNRYKSCFRLIQDINEASHEISRREEPIGLKF